MLERFKVPEDDRVYVTEEAIRRATETLFTKMGLDEHGAKTAADVLVLNDLRGVESHGVSNMMRDYVKWYQKGALNPTPDLKVNRETATTANIDGDGALGTHIGPDMMRMAIEKAARYGMGAVTVSDSGHLGGCGYHAMLAAEADMIGICMTGRHNLDGAKKGMVPTFGAEPRFGTNPIAWAAPANKQAPFLFDVATTQIASNKIGLAKRVGAELESAWITQTNGAPVMDKAPVPDEYFLLPFGGTRVNGSHKGYGFATVCAIMCQTLAGADLIRTGSKHNEGYHFFAAYQIEAFCDIDEFKSNMDEMLARLANTKPAPGHDRVLYPGLSEGEETNKRRRDGIPYHREVIDWYHFIGEELGVAIALP